MNRYQDLKAKGFVQFAWQISPEDIKLIEDLEDAFRKKIYPFEVKRDRVAIVRAAVKFLHKEICGSEDEE